MTEVRAVVALAPSNVVWGSFGPGSGDDVPAWTLEGRPIPWLTASNDAAWAEAAKTSPYVGTPAYLVELDAEAAAAAEIPVERARCPILMVSGEDDAMWPSTAMADRVVERALAHGSTAPPVHVRFPDAGHRCALPPGLPSPVVSRHPVDHELVAFGGSERGNAAAQAASWRQIIEFLRESPT